MNIPDKPTRYKKLPHFKELPDFGALKKLLQKKHIEAIKTRVKQSMEHTFPIIPYSKQNGLKKIEALKLLHQRKEFDPRAFAPSAFDEGTIQDLKFHEEAHEIYLLLAGRLKILWKKNESATFKDELIITEDIRYAFIPCGHCLLVASERVGAFLAIAFKTKKSTTKNLKKVLGENCPHYKSIKVRCEISEFCECLRANRSSFFDAVRTSRVTALTNAKTITQVIALNRSASS